MAELLGSTRDDVEFSVLPKAYDFTTTPCATAAPTDVNHNLDLQFSTL